MKENMSKYQFKPGEEVGSITIVEEVFKQVPRGAILKLTNDGVEISYKVYYRLKKTNTIFVRKLDIRTETE